MLIEHSEIVPRYLKGIGTEIGAFKTPIPGVRPIYVDRFASFAGQPTLAEYYGDACDLPFCDSSLDYVASSHVIEHVANPVLAFSEWYRVLRHGGIIYCVVPHRQKTFDRTRALTDPEHIWQDFQRKTTAVDATHIDEYCYGIDWDLFSPGQDAAAHQAERSLLAQRYHSAVSAGLEINIHFHTFEPPSFLTLLDICNRRKVWPGKIEICEVHDCFPKFQQIGFLIVARVSKSLSERLGGLRKRELLKLSSRRLDPSV